MKSTVFTDIHIELGAKMAEFAGYNMPIEYSGIKDEHINIRNNVGVFDVSHMGEFWVKGPNAEGFIQSLTSNDVRKLSDGKIQYTTFINETGGIIDDLLVYRIDSETFLLVVNASNIQKDWDWCAKNAKEQGLEVGKELYNASEEICQLAIQGPKAIEIIQKIVSEDISDIPYYNFRKVNVAGINNAILSITGYTGAGGCEIYVANEDGVKLWNAIFEAGKGIGIKPAGLGARDTLRIESGYCLYGNDIDDTTSPLEAGLGWITKLNDDNNFIARDIIEQQKSSGVSRKLKGFVLIERGIPRSGYLIVDGSGDEIGKVTSGTISPLLNKGIGLGYLNSEYANIGESINIKIRNKLIKAEVVKVPFK